MLESPDKTLVSFKAQGEGLEADSMNPWMLIQMLAGLDSSVYSHKGAQATRKALA